MANDTTKYIVRCWRCDNEHENRQPCPKCGAFESPGSAGWTTEALFRVALETIKEDGENSCSPDAGCLGTMADDALIACARGNPTDPSPVASSKTCRTCAHRRPIEDTDLGGYQSGVGACHCGPPTALLFENGTTGRVWPLVPDFDECGQYQEDWEGRDDG